MQASQTTQQKTLKKYTAADYDSDRATVREWLSKRPQAASVKTVQSGNDSDLEVTLQPDVSDKASRRLAHEIRVYLTHHLPGERALAVSQVSLLGGKGSAHPDSEQSQSDGSSSLPVSAIVTTSFNAGTSNDAEHPDTSWHVFVNGDQVE